MKKARFSIEINATPEKVWDILWNEDTYSKWTSIFNESSYAISDWEEGSKIQFLSSDGNGMFSVIDKKVPGEYMSFKHMGIVRNGEEQHTDKETENWTGAKENYTLVRKNGGTELSVEMEMTDDFQKYFEDTFPQALQKVKEMAEN